MAGKELEMDFDSINRRALDGAGCSREEAMFLAAEVELDILLNGADAVREKYFAKDVSLCAIINARSGACVEDCRFCSQSAHSEAGADVYELLPSDKIEQDARDVNGCGAVNYGVVTSGATVEGEDLERVCKVAESIHKETGLKVCASLGRFTEENLRKLKEAGLERYHHNLETSENFYSSICTTHSWQERLDTVKAAQRVGLQVCSGGLFGLCERWGDRVDMALTLRDTGIDSVPLNFLHSHRGTPLEHQPPLTADEALRIIGVYRHLLPKATLRVCGGRPKILGSRQYEIFHAGANAMMTGNYLTTSGITPDDDVKAITGLGFKIC